MCTRAGLLIAWDDVAKRALVTWANCDSWACPDCSRRMAERWGIRAAMGTREILKRGEPLDFVTITSHERLKDFAATEAVWRLAWNSLYCAIKRQTVNFQYMIVPERHKDGRMHVHALWNAGVTQRWLKDNARKRGLGYQCKIIPIADQGYAAKYVTKYVGKSLGDFHAPHFRRVRVSRNWADIPAANTEVSGLRWEHVGTNGSLQHVYEECQAKGITLVDMKTGEVFDDVDLGTIIYA